MSDGNTKSRRFAGIVAPILVLALFLAVLLMLLRLPLVLPLGPMYWDLALYLDAAQRIAEGQIHSLDFAAPVGPLGYYLFAHAARLLPEAHPLLIAQWSPLVFTAPLMALIIVDVGRKSVATAWALLLPFMLFSALPFNLIEYFPYPGVDGFGIYNRQTSHVLYVLACALIFARNPVVMAVVLAVTGIALFLLKITGFVAGGLLLVFAILAGRIGWGVLLVAMAGFYGVLGWLEMSTGIIFAYLKDIILLVESNSDSLLRRFLTALSVEFRVVGAGALLAAAMLWFSRASMMPTYSENLSYLGRRRAINAVFNAPVSWVAALLVVCTIFETQNTGSHGFIALWPAVWLVLTRLGDFEGAARIAVATLCAATALPSAVEIVHRAARTAASAPLYVPLEHENLKTLGRVSAKREFIEHADALQAHYIRHRRAYMELAEAGQLPSFLLYSEPSFQLVWLRELDRLVTAIREWERETGRRLDTVYTADFSNPLHWLLDREAPRHKQIGADVERTFRQGDEAMIEALKATDAIFLPRCPETNARLTFRVMILPALEGRQAIEITPCYTMMLKRDPG